MYGEHKCVVCDEAITNPICLECLEVEVRTWMRETGTMLVPKLGGFTDIFRGFTHAGTSCVICSNNMNICAHCYCKEIVNWLINEDNSLAQEFVTVFNYELHEAA